MNKQTFSFNETGITNMNDFIRSSLKLNENDKIDVIHNSNFITLTKNGDFCFICGSYHELTKIGNNKLLCRECLNAIKETISD